MIRFEIDPEEAKFLGIPTVKVPSYTEVEPFIPETYRQGPTISCLKAIKADVLGGVTLCALCVQDEGFVDVVIVTGEGFQVDPPSSRDAHKTETKEMAAKMLMEELMVPLLLKLDRYPQDKFDAYIEKWRVAWAKAKEASNGL